MRRRYPRVAEALAEAQAMAQAMCNFLRRITFLSSLFTKKV